MRVVIDTNVLVSAILKDRTPEKVILWVIAQPDCEWIVSSAILNEYREVLARDKFRLPTDILQSWYAHIEKHTILIPVSRKITFPPDPSDAKFIACALHSNAHFLVTGDRGFIAARKLLQTMVVSVSQFYTLACSGEG